MDHAAVLLNQPTGGAEEGGTANVVEPSTKEAAPVHCPACRTRQLVLIDMRIGGETVRMASCSSCDARWWEGTDGSLPLAEVLELAGRA